MEFWLFSFFILFAIVLQRRLSDANPNVTLMGNGHFQDGQDLVLTCRVDVNVDLLSVSFFKGISETIWINDPVSCTFFNLVPDGTSRYNTTCNPTTNTFTMIKYALKFSDDKTVWSCQMKSNTGGTGPCVGANNPCISGYITLKLDDTTSASPSTDCALASFLGLALGVGLGSAAICIICLIVIWVKTCKTEKLAVDIDIGKTLRQHGSDVKIICSVYGSEKKSVDWTGQEENQLTDVGRCTIASFDSSTNKSSLIIRTSSMTKTEGYICQVAFRKSGVSVKIYITITVLDNGSLKVSIEKIILFVPASENERRKWIGPQKTVLPNTGRYTIVPYDSITNESHITIKNFSMNDHGSYTCQPQNSSVSSPEKSITITTNDAANPNKGASKLIIGFGFGIIVVVCIVCVVILVLIGERCVLKFAIGLGLGLGIPGVGCIIVIVILVKKGFKKPSASENGNVKSGKSGPI